ncbi:MAG: arylesterase [Pseudomonadota bacterium]
MAMRGLTILMATLLLAGCDSEAAPAPGPAASAVTLDEDLPVVGPERTILAFGDSLFAGYNLGPDEGYPERLEPALRARGINARVIDAGVSGDTSAAGRQRIAFVLDNMATPPDLALVELGGNDLLRGLPPAQTRENIAAILAELKKRDIPVLLMGMRAPPNLGVEFQAEFDALYPALAQEYDVPLVPFFLAAVFDQPALIQDDRIHPTAEGIVQIVGATVEQVAGAIPAE